MHGPSSSITIAPKSKAELLLGVTFARVPTRCELKVFLLLLATWSPRPVRVVLYVAPQSVERSGVWVDALAGVEVGEIEVRFVPEPPEARSA